MIVILVDEPKHNSIEMTIFPSIMKYNCLQILIAITHEQYMQIMYNYITYCIGNKLHIIYLVIHLQSHCSCISQ